MVADSEKSPNDRGSEGSSIPVWDLAVRIGHWALVLLFFVAYLTEDDLLTIHSWAGYGVAIYIALRVVWGLVGSKHARFSDFAYGPAMAARYLKDLLLFSAKRYIGHSPAGGLMVFALLLSLTATTVSGMALLAVEENAGPLAPWLGAAAASGHSETALALLVKPARADDERHGEGGETRRDRNSDMLEEVHESISNFTLFLIIVHIAGVLWASVVHGENLARAMITGRKRPE